MDKYSAIQAFKEKLEGPFDSRIDSFFNNYEEWISIFDDSVQTTVCYMISAYDYITHGMANRSLRYLHECLLEDTEEESSNFLYTFIDKKNGTANSSIEYLIEYKNCNQISKSHVIINLDCIQPDDWENIRNVVIVDDICGSGKSIIDYIERMGEKKKHFRNKTLYYLVIYAMPDSINVLNEYKKKTGIDIVLKTLYKGEKAFANSALTENDKTNFIALSRSLGISEKYILGWECSEALVSFYNNTPNNTIGLFWQSTNGYDAPFPREKLEEQKWKRPSIDKLKNDKRSRTERNYDTKRYGR